MKSVNSDIAYDYVRRRILDGSFPPGHPLLTQSLSAEIGVSRTPVRDALRQLETEGLVVIRTRLGASVKTMDVTEYREMCELRLALEVYAAGLAAEKRTVGDLHDIGDALEAMQRLTEAAGEAEDRAEIMKELRREDVRFHVAIISAAHNEVLKKEVRRLHVVDRVMTRFNSSALRTEQERALNRSEVQESHRKIHRAIEEGDSAGAKVAMEDHLQDLIDKVIRAMLRAERLALPQEVAEEEWSYAL